VNRSEAAREITKRIGYPVDHGVLRLSWEDAVIFLADSPNYTEEELDQACRVASMRAAGLSLQTIRATVDHARGRGGDVQGTNGRQFVIVSERLGLPRDATAEQIIDRVHSLADENAELRRELGRTSDPRFNDAVQRQRGLRTGLSTESGQNLSTALTHGEEIDAAYRRHVADAKLAGRPPLKFPAWLEIDREKNAKRWAGYELERREGTPENLRRDAIYTTRRAAREEALARAAGRRG
jgi:DNA-binding transcriptional MerR regulator